MDETGGRRADGPGLPRLMLVSDRRRVRGGNPLAVVREAALGGVGMIQLREKDLTPAELASVVRRIREAVPPSTLLVVNGCARVALEERTGLHLPAAMPRPAGAACRPLGRSIHDAGEAARALADGVDYVVAGHVHATDSKPGVAPRGVGWLAGLSARLAPVPVYAIGGITVARVAEAIGAGAWGVAVSGAILASPEPRRVAEALTRALELAVSAGPRAPR